MDNHPKSFDTGTGLIGVYEHVLVAENLLGRRLLEGEVVHHLDENRSNNSPDNLLVMGNPMHIKLHGWMNKNIIIPKPDYQNRKELGCIRCAYCETPIDANSKFCSKTCHNLANSDVNHPLSTIKTERPNKEDLENLINSKSMVAIGKQFNVSDNAVRKWCLSYGIELPTKKSKTNNSA